MHRLTLAFFASLFASHAAASTYIALNNYGEPLLEDEYPCTATFDGAGVSTSTVASFDCPVVDGKTASVFGSANPGKVRSSVSMIMNFDDPYRSGSYVAYSAGFESIANIMQTISITDGPSEGLFEVVFHVEGFGNFEATGARAEDITAEFLVESWITPYSRFNFDSAGGAPGGVEYFDDDFTIDRTLRALIPYTDGEVTFGVYLRTAATCNGYAALTGTCTVTNDFSNSATFVSASVFDTAGDEVVGARLTSASGFSYAGTIAPVPLPASLPLLLGALGIGALVARRSLTP